MKSKAGVYTLKTSHSIWGPLEKRRERSEICDIYTEGLYASRLGSWIRDSNEKRLRMYLIALHYMEFT